jgi:hypothetical protein
VGICAVANRVFKNNEAGIRFVGFDINTEAPLMFRFSGGDTPSAEPVVS